MRVFSGNTGQGFHIRQQLKLLFDYIVYVAPGLFLTALIAGQAFALHLVSEFSIFSPMILAFIIGMIFRNIVGNAAGTRIGIAICSKHVLLGGIILLGFQFNIQKLAAVGWTGAFILVATSLVVFLLVVAFGRVLAVDRGLAMLIAVGTSICGASAVVATNVITRKPAEDVATAIACVTIFGTTSMLIYPMIAKIIGMEELAYGLWVGASVHEVAQVVAAGFQYSQQAGEFAVITKLGRVLMLVPLILVLSCCAMEQKAKTISAPGQRKTSLVPWFVVGFAALMLINSYFALPDTSKAYVSTAASIMLVMAMAAIGLQTNASKLVTKGCTPLLLGASAWGVISLFSFALVTTIAGYGALY